MGCPSDLTVALERLHVNASRIRKSSTILAAGLAAAAISLGLAEAAVHVEALHGPLDRHGLLGEVAGLAQPRPAPATVTRTVWVGVDLDGDGQPDVANPTGHAPRGVDAYGEGCFHASRDGGAREHEGVDYVARAGQAVTAPISGYVSKIGYAYPDNQILKFVEIDNPALHVTARVFYVDPEVAVGDAVAIGHPIGTAHSLQQRYRGITDHVHLEIAESGRKVDAQRLIVARNETVPVEAAGD
ncbi:MAG: peptidoglycan DD-metalloendopeptidase family protein [Proteobacteria bacterium]|nr:peptidoglycan DD-metalloendopeptidase family protein [Pseudomonadota bacterium]